MRMSEEVLKRIREEIKRAEQELQVAYAIIERLRAAGEDVSKLLQEYMAAKTKLERFKKAFEVE